MNEEVQELFRQVADLSTERRSQYFAERGVDESTRKEVEELLQFDSDTSTFIEHPVGLEASQVVSRLQTVEGRCGQYELLRLIGRGGMGLVYLAERCDGELQQKAAVKLLRFAGDSDAVRQRFLKERQILANLAHPNIARLLDAGHREDGQPYLVMEYIHGKTIDEHCQSLPLRSRVELLARVCEAVFYAHRQLVVHRDLKPGNILVDEEGVPKLLDFGIAKLLDPAGEVTATIDRPLTQGFASPEQLSGKPVGVPTDIYSLGAILYRVLTGSNPFRLSGGQTPAELELAICQREVTRPSQTNSDIDRDLDAIVLKAMRKEAKDRYATARELGDDLKAWLDGRSVGARSGDRWYRSKRYVRKRWPQFALGIIILTVVMAGWFLVRRQALVGRRFEITRTTRLTSVGQSFKASISPDGRYIAHTLLAGGQESLRIMQAKTLQDVEIVPPRPVRYAGVTFGPDSSAVFYVLRIAGSELSQLYRIPVTGGPGKLLKAQLDSPVTFSPDGTKYAFVRETGEESTLIMADLNSGREQQLVAHRLPQVMDYPAWSPDGRTIAYTVGDLATPNPHGSDARILALDVTNRTERALSLLKWAFIRQLAWVDNGQGIVMSARDPEMGMFHIWHVAYPAGSARKVTDGLVNEVGASVTRDSHQVVTVEERTLSSVWRLSLNRIQDPELVTPGSEPAAPVSSPDGKIVFEQQLNGWRNIWVTDPNGQNQKQLTQIGNNYDPSISGDGRTIVFVSDRSGHLELWRMSRNGQDQAMVTPVDGETTPSPSPDGKWIAYDAIGSHQWTTLRRVEVTGGRMKELNDRLWRMPVVSPDGRWIAGFYEDSNLSSQKNPSRIAVISSEGGPPAKLISIPPSVLKAAGLRWSVDGRELTYVNRRSDGDNLWSQPLNGGIPRQLTQFHGGALFRFDWSRDGKQLVFCRGVQARNVMLLQDASFAE